MVNEKNSWQRSVTPLLFFVALYLGCGLSLGIPPTACALAGLALSLFLNTPNFQAQVSAFITGAREETVLYMCLIFLLAGAFSTLSKQSGSLDAVVNLGISLIPHYLMLPGIFVISSLVALAMGTSMGTIATIAPVGIAIAQSTGADLSLTMGAILSGAMFGDNLSVISDTTIAATGSLNCDMRSKMMANLPLALVAATITIVAFYFCKAPPENISAPEFSFIQTLPYFLVLILAVSGLNVIAVLLIGIFCSASVGIFYHSISLKEIGLSINAGFLSVSEILFLSLFVAGLAGIAMKGGIQKLMSSCELIIRGRRSAEAVIASLVSLIDICVANNTIAILISGKVAKEIAQKYSLPAPRVASLLDIFSCVWQGLLPYGAQILLLSSLSQLEPLALVPYSWYPMALGLVTILSIILQRPRASKTPYYASV